MTGSSTLGEFTVGDEYDGLPYGPMIPPDTPLTDLQSPLWLFNKFWSDDMSNIVIAQTNLYAFQQVADNPTPAESSHRTFKSTDKSEFCCFLAALIALAVPEHTNFQSAYGERTTLDILKEAMSLNRFEQLLRYLHCADNNRDDKTDPLHKIRALLTCVNKNCKSNWVISAICAIDEMDIGWRGLRKYKERITYKKAGDGFLVYALCDAEGYVFTFAVKFDKTWKRDIDGLKTTFSAVLHLVDELREVFPGYKYGEIYADNLYSSIPLIESLLKRNVYYCGTLRATRKPLNFALKKDDPVGTMKQLHKGHMTVVLWRPKPEKEVKMITSIHRPVKVKTIQRRRPGFDNERGYYRRQFLNVDVPDCSADYNMYTNAVDIANQLRSYYTTRRRTNKWWHRLFFFILDTAICNAYVSYKRYWKLKRKERGVMEMMIWPYIKYEVIGSSILSSLRNC